MGPQLWPSCLCRGYRKACEDVSNLKYPGLAFGALLGRQTHSPDDCLSVHLHSWPFLPRARVSLFLPNRLFKTPHMVCVESRSKSRPLLCALVTKCSFVMAWCQILYNPTADFESRRLFSQCTTAYPRIKITRVLEMLSLVASGESH